MKIAIITLHSQNSNYGSILQGYGLKQYLTTKGYETQIIDYRPSYSNGAIGVKGKIKAFIRYTLFLPYYISRSLKFSEFIKSNDNLTDIRYRTYKDLCNNPPIADLYISGSDQIWNPAYKCGQDKAYFLKFTDSENKISYASSIGSTELSKKDYLIILNNLVEYKHISVREKYSQLQLVQRGLKETKHVCDPVFLLSASHYRGIYNYKKEERYILVYAVHKDSFLEKIVDRVALFLNIKVISLGGFAKKCRSDKFPRGIGPREFLGYFDNAEIIITSSFHGTAFSLIFNKQFIIVPPRASRLRIDNILGITGTTDRVVSSYNEIERLLENEIDYSKVNSKLDDFISNSKQYLNESIRDLMMSANK